MSRPTKWAGRSSRTHTAGKSRLDTVITGHLTQEQLEAYQWYFRVEETSDLLRRAGRRGNTFQDLLPLKSVRSFARDPSPPPEYDQRGNRTNTRDARMRESLEKERDVLVDLAVSSVRHYDPPVDYRKPEKTSEKLYIPTKDYPDINFVGLLLGPRGNTLRHLQDESGARLAIRGKGSVKDGKLAADDRGGLTEEDLHVVVSADTSEKIDKAIRMTNEVIEKAILAPADQNELKRDQLRELAVLNGTLRERKPFIPPDVLGKRRPMGMDVTQVVCRICNKVGHFARDCKLKGQNYSQPNYGPNNGPNYGPSYGQPELVDTYKPQKRPAEEELPPWKRQNTGIPPPPQANAPPAPPAPSAPLSVPPPPSSLPPPPSSLPPPPPAKAPPPPPAPPGLAPPPPPPTKQPPPPGPPPPPKL